MRALVRDAVAALPQHRLAASPDDRDASDDNSTRRRHTHARHPTTDGRRAEFCCVGVGRKMKVGAAPPALICARGLSKKNLLTDRQTAVRRLADTAGSLSHSLHSSATERTSRDGLCCEWLRCGGAAPWSSWRRPCAAPASRAQDRGAQRNAYQLRARFSPPPPSSVGAAAVCACNNTIHNSRITPSRGWRCCQSPGREIQQPLRRTL